jgi:hypothetical protein
VRYAINVKRVGKGRGVRVSVDGRALEGATVPFPPHGTEAVRVDVELG